MGLWFQTDVLLCLNDFLKHYDYLVLHIFDENVYKDVSTYFMNYLNICINIKILRNT